MTDLPIHEAWLTLTPEQNAAGGEFTVRVRRAGARLTLAVQVPPGQPEDTILRLRDLKVGDERVDVHVRRAIRPLMRVWPVAAIGSAVFLAGWLNGPWMPGLFGGLVLLGLAGFARVTGRLPFASGPGRRLRDAIFLAWLLVVGAAATSGLAVLRGLDPADARPEPPAAAPDAGP
jgi:hypothetical protein